MNRNYVWLLFEVEGDTEEVIEVCPDKPTARMVLGQYGKVSEITHEFLNAVNKNGDVVARAARYRMRGSVQ
jgi:precorrin-6B methylase 2